MSRPDQRVICRAASLALFGVLWFILGARPARAEGCHVADRPTLGLTFSWEAGSERAAVPPPTIQTIPLVRRPPCSQATPGPKLPELLISSCALLTRTTSAVPGLSGPLAAPPRGLTSCLLATRLDRPPRVV
ncbi:MAG: hypothetical protein P4L84_21885 [Isosphaeraceae bacterium]|nr:hypothetical protein [Isosphaeraceae bacterium]